MNITDKKETFEIPKAWSDMMDKSSMFTNDIVPSLYRHYGLKDFIVLECVRNVKHAVRLGVLLGDLRLVARKTGW